jgi:hypothetical protein
VTQNDANPSAKDEWTKLPNVVLYTNQEREAKMPQSAATILRFLIGTPNGD